MRVRQLEEEVRRLRDRAKLPTRDWVSRHPAVSPEPALAGAAAQDVGRAGQTECVHHVTMTATCKLVHLIFAKAVVWLWLWQHLLLV